MTRRILWTIVIGAMLGVTGCSQDVGDSDASSAEIPQPGPAVTDDPGPAPADQWEPPIQEESAPNSADPSDNPPPADGQIEEAAADASEVFTPIDHEDVSLRLQSWEETEQLIASYKGKVVVVDFWSTSCLPCRREFPHLVELHRKYGDQIACVSVSLDYTGRKSRPPESYREDVLGFLAQQRATIDNVLNIDDPDELQERLQLPPIPLVWVYDQSGVRQKAFHNADRQGEEFTYSEHVVPYLKGLLTGT